MAKQITIQTEYLTYIDSPIGRIELKADEDGLKAAIFLDEGTEEQPEHKPNHPTLKAAAKQLKEYFAGDRKDFDLPLSPNGTEFQQQVWKELESIPWGQTTSYLKIAETVGTRLTIRAVGGANGKNPIAIIIPCHRVIGTDGKLTGYAGGLWRKQWLLKLEGQFSQLKLDFWGG